MEAKDMEIRYLTNKEKEISRSLYEEVFVEDEEAFVDAYYKIKAADNQILAAVEEGHIRSMLHRNPYTFRFRGKCVHADYLVAVATKRTYRHQGLMRRILVKALQDMEREGQPFAFLMPADEAIYLPFDFRLMGNDDEESLADLKSAQLSEEYDLYIEKDEAYERRHIPWPEWETTPMMIRLLHLPSFLRQIGAAREQSLTVAITDPILAKNQGTFRWELTTEGSRLLPVQEEPELEISIGDLGSFLCGMLGPEELPGISEAADGKMLKEKLNRIQVLEGIYINETV